MFFPQFLQIIENYKKCNFFHFILVKFLVVFRFDNFLIFKRQTDPGCFYPGWDHILPQIQSGSHICWTWKFSLNFQSKCFFALCIDLFWKISGFVLCRFVVGLASCRFKIFNFLFSTGRTLAQISLTGFLVIFLIPDFSKTLFQNNSLADLPKSLKSTDLEYQLLVIALRWRA